MLQRYDCIVTKVNKSKGSFQAGRLVLEGKFLLPVCRKDTIGLVFSLKERGKTYVPINAINKGKT